jgi:hypothetical protein
VGKKRKPYGWGINIAWMSSIGPGEPPEDGGLPEEWGRAVRPVVEEDSGPGDSWRAEKDLHKNPKWKAWLTKYMSRDDLFLMVRVDEVPKVKVTTGYSRKSGERSFTYWLPVHEFIERSERDVMRAAYVGLYQRVAEELELPAPPADPGPRKKVA